MTCILPLVTNVWLIQVQTLKLEVLPHFQMNISVPGNTITPCEGNMSTVYHKGIIIDDCNKNFNRVTIIMINDI
jgi:hypothetical protein